MTLIFKQLFGFVKLLNSDKGINQIAAGITFGLVLGFIPAFSLQTIIVMLFLFMLRVQIGAAFLSAAFFSVIAFMLDSLFHSVGVAVLGIGFLEPLYTSLYNMPVVPYTRFNNTIVMGASVMALIFAPIVFFLAKIFVNKYRVKVVDGLKDTKLFKAIKATSLFKWYHKYDQLYG